MIHAVRSYAHKGENQGADPINHGARHYITWNMIIRISFLEITGIPCSRTSLKTRSPISPFSRDLAVTQDTPARFP